MSGDEHVIGDWVYAEEAKYLQARLDAWHKFGDPIWETAKEWNTLEKLLYAYIEAHTLPDGKTRRSLFQTESALGLGYAISIIIERWDSRSDYPFQRYARKARR